MRVSISMMSDPLITPPELLDLILQERPNYSGEAEQEVDQEVERWERSVVASFYRLVFSPLEFLIFIMDSWVEDRVRKILRKTDSIRNNRK